MIGPKTSALVAALGATLILAVAGSSSPVAASSAGDRQTGPTLSSAVSTANPLARVARPSQTWQRLPAAPIPAPYTLASVWTGPQMKLPGLYSVTSGEPHSRHLIVSTPTGNTPRNAGR